MCPQLGGSDNPPLLRFTSQRVSALPTYVFSCLKFRTATLSHNPMPLLPWLRRGVVLIGRLLSPPLTGEITYIYYTGLLLLTTKGGVTCNMQCHSCSSHVGDRRVTTVIDNMQSSHRVIHSRRHSQRTLLQPPSHRYQHSSSLPPFAARFLIFERGSSNRPPILLPDLNFACRVEGSV